ncbi:transcriptional regulator, BadM/Rrf2 family [Peptoniphilus asaccharolyticus DSM 20463]|uniref:Transcriptional regulator, BadM/Rrf2 family n=1 Tax=Peptoniphilus asaccharolyticus DSM 20463 TaxID=573058 RepID=A0A1W1UPA4_PEPAS|nr:Rrf2 family transcriptional regulator [Peptoniphilus asaccharolyticus]MBL7574986.1 Rrf2 family transcriptional regulator [Peptoniphilus asaccharolyticus]SMB82900.1 transcriptional regulator, BadM/Rrf2 family [Peptoniphilus asaccharolyticus DSM 20463]
MKLSTKGRYGLMAMHRLSINYGKGPISISEIAREENLSEAYLEQLFTLLKKNDLVKSSRGAKGGYQLKKAPEETKIGEILNALEGNIAISCKNLSSSDCRGIKACEGNSCATKNILDTLQEKLDNVLDSLTLADME